MTPRILIAGTGSGCGKTTVACAILQALKQDGLRLMACKSGPDYIDPMFHSHVIGTESGNLDLFFTDGAAVRHLLHRRSSDCDLTVLEGAMGYYDGIGMTSEASAWALARETRTPAVLVVDGQGSGVSVCAVIQGFQRFLPDSGIQGVILNRVSPMLYPRLKSVIEDRCSVRVFGFLPNLPECAIESRHLGLLTAPEVQNLKEKLALLAQQVHSSVDLSALLELGRSAPALENPDFALPEPVGGHPVIAVARDEAFCFYYQDNLDLLEYLGAELAEFSPLRDETLPDCDGLYLGGGYPELYAAQLSRNTSMREQIRRAIQGGLPTVAECGGYLYLQQTLEDASGHGYPMCGVFPGRGVPMHRLRRFGYVELTARSDTLLCARGERIRGHEFHYWDTEDPGRAFQAQKPLSDRSWECVHASKTLYAGFPHLHFYSNLQAAKRFVSAALRKKKEDS